MVVVYGWFEGWGFLECVVFGGLDVVMCVQQDCWFVVVCGVCGQYGGLFLFVGFGDCCMEYMDVVEDVGVFCQCGYCFGVVFQLCLIECGLGYVGNVYEVVEI